MQDRDAQANIKNGAIKCDFSKIVTSLINYNVIKFIRESSPSHKNGEKRNAGDNIWQKKMRLSWKFWRFWIFISKFNLIELANLREGKRKREWEREERERGRTKRKREREKPTQLTCTRSLPLGINDFTWSWRSKITKCIYKLIFFQNKMSYFCRFPRLLD